MFVALKKISDGLDKLCKVLLIVAISVLIIVMTAQIIARAGFNVGISWADGLARYMLIWSTFLGAACAMKENSHITLTFIPDKLKGNALKWYSLAIGVLIFIFVLVMCYIGISVVKLVWPQKADSIAISVAFIYLAIPFAHIVMLVHLLTNYIELMRTGRLNVASDNEFSGS